MLSVITVSSSTSSSRNINNISSGRGGGRGGGGGTRGVEDPRFRSFQTRDEPRDETVPLGGGLSLGRIGLQETLAKLRNLRSGVMRAEQVAAIKPQER